MEWKEKISREMSEAGIEDCGRLQQKECAKLYLEGRIMAYPSNFYEIDCISIKKAQAVSCLPVTTDFAAMNESNISGIKIHTKTSLKDWAKPYQIGFGMQDEEEQKKWANAVVKELKKPFVRDIYHEAMFPSKFSWVKIASDWTNLFI